MSDSLRTVGNGTFMNAGLTEITLPDSLTGRCHASLQHGTFVPFGTFLSFGRPPRPNPVGRHGMGSQSPGNAAGLGCRATNGNQPGSVSDDWFRTEGYLKSIFCIERH